MPKKSSQNGFTCGCGKLFKFYSSLREHRTFSKSCSMSAKELNGMNDPSKPVSSPEKSSSPSKGNALRTSPSSSRSPSPETEEKEPIDTSEFDAVVYFSGDCRPQPGWGAICVLLYQGDNIVKCLTESLPWFPIGNVKAEYMAFCEAIELAAEFDWIEKLLVIGDSETVYKHFNGQLPLYYSSNNHSMKPIYERAMRSVKNFKAFHFHRCSREENETAKNLSKHAIPGPQSNSSSARMSPMNLPLSAGKIGDEFDFDDFGDSTVFADDFVDDMDDDTPAFMPSTRAHRRQSTSSSDDSFSIDLEFDAFHISDISRDSADLVSKPLFDEEEDFPAL